MSSQQRPQTQYASQGGVTQNGGSLPITHCKRCHVRIVWPTSRRTGKRYPVTVSRGYHDQPFYIGSNVHRCKPGSVPGTIPYAWAVTGRSDGAGILIYWLRRGFPEQ